MNNDLFVRKIVFEREKVEDFKTYPFNIEVIKGLEEIELQKPVTFFVGENGIGKSTLIEAIAIALRLNPEGGSQNFCFSTKNTHSELSNYRDFPKIKVTN